MSDLLDDLPDGVLVADESGSVSYLNRAAERISGWTREQAAGRPWGEVLQLRDAGGLLVHERSDPYRHRIRITTGTPEREFLLRRRDGEDRWVAVRASYRRNGDGRIEQAVVTLRDIERRRRLEKHSSDLISTVSHEIRSPLTSVKGFTSTLLRKWGEFTDEQKHHMLTMINHDADRVTRLLTDLLDVSRLEAGRLELRRQPVDIAEIARKVTARLEHETTDHEIRLTAPARLPSVSGDPGKIEQVITNLVENAIKYADPGPIVVEAGRDDGGVVVRVSDEGPGIDPQHQPHIFTKFYRRGSGERRPGTGLGLYICKGIVEAHGGRIELERSGAEGSVFAIHLPVTEE